MNPILILDLLKTSLGLTCKEVSLICSKDQIGVSRALFHHEIES